MRSFRFLSCILFGLVALVVRAGDLANVRSLEEKKLLITRNGKVSVGIDSAMGASITYLSWSGYDKNAVNIHDPGRLIQQSYYAGVSRDRRGEGQLEHWSPWPWNPIQGGGVGSWARVTKIEKNENGILFAETVPKLWDMPDEEAGAVMRQWTGFEPGLANVILVECVFLSARPPEDEWGGGIIRHQEVPALYFTRNFSRFLIYEGRGRWRQVKQEPGPPWGKADPPLKVMGCFDEDGVGVAVFSPGATGHWNFGPHGQGSSEEAEAGPCVHLAPLVALPLGPRSRVRYRYWMVTGSREEVAVSVDKLVEKYGQEEVEFEADASIE